MPSFVADVAGEYVVQLIVNDGTVPSAPDSVVISAAGVNLPPVADAGPDQAVDVGDTVQLDGSGSSDPDSDPLTYSWSFDSVPTGSTANLSDSTAVMPSFVADVAGEYVVQLIVNDGTVPSDPDSVVIVNSQCESAAGRRRRAGPGSRRRGLGACSMAVARAIPTAIR